jgi:adenine-specific DNA-methyltransferase
MGEELKKTGAGNLFTVFGEPDIEIAHPDPDSVVVTLKGVDVYDPTTGEIRTNDTGQIALWMIDTAYNEESFFVRHCYFTGGNDPYRRLKTALKAEIDEDAWASLYSTVSRPFPRPESGKIAVKVINDYGDEVMKVFEVV